MGPSIAQSALYVDLQGFSLKALRHLVLDEADRLLNMDFEQEIDQILKSVPRDRRTQLFSATMTSKARALSVPHPLHSGPSQSAVCTLKSHTTAA
jgi:superfamily II DNA/RNA helicase